MSETKNRVALLSAFAMLYACSDPASNNTPEPVPLPDATYVGAAECVDCHAEETQA